MERNSNDLKSYRKKIKRKRGRPCKINPAKQSNSKDLKSYRKKGRPCKKTPAKESKCSISNTQIKFGSAALGKICNMGKNNKLYKQKGWGEFQLIFGNGIPDKSDESDNGRKLKFTYLSVALKQDNVVVLEQKLEHLQLKPKKQIELTATAGGDCNKGNSLKKCSGCRYKSTDDIIMLEHLMTHTREYFVCEVCGAKCYDILELRKHMVNHTSYKPFACTDCDFLCLSLEEIKIHFASH
ncbi:unnamed protein product [Meganyctiphanes norvegica]|uniref:C2H2-type domain-containing protein n=1 Tax=Meganyctiphanes norvegica TaxID=48144 RepID=A0AAV2R324_MEGNR